VKNNLHPNEGRGGTLQEKARGEIRTGCRKIRKRKKRSWPLFPRDEVLLRGSMRQVDQRVITAEKIWARSFALGTGVLAIIPYRRRGAKSAKGGGR